MTPGSDPAPRPAAAERTPRQNRVTPFGALIAVESRGTLMGNRGCLHDDQQRIRRPFACKRWITCVLEFRGRYRTVMTPGRYTELFFLDEATALAAGHRPCAECQHARYRLFREAWAEANAELIGGSSLSADEIDRVLHAERVDDRRGKRTYLARVSELPSGAMIADDEGVPYLVHGQRLLRWEPGGYGRSIPKPGGIVSVLTPKSIVRAIGQGYPVMTLSSAG
jgi:hypothetical protein